MDERSVCNDEEDSSNGIGDADVVQEDMLLDLGAKQPETVYISHFRNEMDHSVYTRYGVPIFLVCTLIMLINAHFGSGVSAEFVLLRDGNVEEQQELLVVSVFSSVKELWNLESYPLAIFIVLSSIVWPYVKLFLTLFAWMAPYKTPRRRERLIEVIDAVGKWGFVDIVVLVEIMVAFRSTIRLATTVTLEIVVLAKWGFYVFVFATVMSLLVTHFILHRHRQVHYPSSEERTGVESADEGVRIKERNGRISICMMAFVWYMVGCFSDTYQVENTRGDVSFATDYSIVSVGKAIPESQLDPNNVGTRFLQFMWFFLCVVMPLSAFLLFGILFAIPLSQVWAERIFFMGGIAFAWSCAEVLLVSSIFAVLQMPTFGDGLIEANCTQCFVIDTKLLLNFIWLCSGTMMCVILNFGLYGHAHRIVYGVL